MQTIAHETGGRAYYNTNDLTGSMMEAFNDGSNYYSISYVPTDQKWDGQFRKIRLDVDREETKLYYRQGYYAEEPDKLKHSFPSPDSDNKDGDAARQPGCYRDHLSSEGETRGRSTGDPGERAGIEVAGGQGTPALDWAGGALHDRVRDQPLLSFSFIPRPAATAGRLTFSAIAYDADGKMLNADIGGFATPLSAEVYAAVQRDALHIRTGIDLPPGKVFLRVGVHDLTTNKIGAFEIPLEVNGDTRAAK